MGRPLKIKKTTTTDIGFNSFSELTNPVYPATLNTAQFLGVVGGANAIGGSSVATSTYPVVRVQVYLSTGGPGNAEAAGFIITQKGSKQYLVADSTTVADESMVVGRTYIIKTVGTTQWQTCGAAANASAGDIFTCVAAGSGSGTAFEVGVCTLANQATGALTSGNMNIAMFNGDSSDILISKLTNKWALDYSSPAVRYVVNFFTDEGTEIKSGTINNVTVPLAIVENYTS